MGWHCGISVVQLQCSTDISTHSSLDTLSAPSSDQSQGSFIDRRNGRSRPKRAYWDTMLIKCVYMVASTSDWLSNQKAYITAKQRLT